MPVSEAKLLWISPPSYQEALNDQPSPYEENGYVELWGFQDKTVSCSRCGVLCFFLENKASVSFSCLLKNGILSGHYILAYAGYILLNSGVYRQSSISFPHQTNCDNIFIKINEVFLCASHNKWIGFLYTKVLHIFCRAYLSRTYKQVKV